MTLSFIVTYSPLPIAIGCYLIYWKILDPMRSQLSHTLNTELSVFQMTSIMTKNLANYVSNKIWGKFFNISHLTPTSYNVPYYHNNLRYCYPLVIKKGPKNDYKIFTDGKDITAQILPYFGPNVDLYQLQLTPKMLGYSSLQIERQNVEGENRSVVFQANEKILLSSLLFTQPVETV